MDEPRSPTEAGRAEWYVPDDGLVRATVDASCCLTEPIPHGAAEVLHLIACASCQSFVESAARTDPWSAAQFIPSDTITLAVVARSAAPRFRFPWDDRQATSERGRQPARAAAALIALGLSPSVLAAAVLAHAAALAAAGAWRAASIHPVLGVPNAPAARHARLGEHVAYVALSAPPSSSASGARRMIGRGVNSDLETSVRQSIRVVAGQVRVSVADGPQLSRTAATLRRLGWATVRVEADSTQDALRTAEEVSGYLGRRGVDPRRRRIVVHHGLANVDVVLDGTPPATSP